MGAQASYPRNLEPNTRIDYIREDCNVSSIGLDLTNRSKQDQKQHFHTYFLSHARKVMCKALVSRFKFSLMAAAAASIFCFGVVVSRACSLRAWRCRLKAAAFSAAVFAPHPRIPLPSETAGSFPSPPTHALPQALLSSSSLKANLPADRTRIPSKSLTTTASAVIVNRVSYV